MNSGAFLLCVAQTLVCDFDVRSRRLAEGHFIAEPSPTRELLKPKLKSVLLTQKSLVLVTQKSLALAAVGWYIMARHSQADSL